MFFFKLSVNTFYRKERRINPHRGLPYFPLYGFSSHMSFINKTYTSIPKSMPRL